MFCSSHLPPSLPLAFSRSLSPPPLPPSFSLLPSLAQVMQCRKLCSLSSQGSVPMPHNMAYSPSNSGTMLCTVSRAMKPIPRTSGCGGDGMGILQLWYGMSPCVGGARSTSGTGVRLCLIWRLTTSRRKLFD